MKLRISPSGHFIISSHWASVRMSRLSTDAGCGERGSISRRSGIAPARFVRIDADLYDSTMHAIEALYPRLSVGGYVVIDDYHVFEECRAAIGDYLPQRGESAPRR